MNDEKKEKLLINMAHNLPTLRAKAKLSQSKLAEMVGVSRQTLVSIENKKRLMSWNVFLACLLIFRNNEATNQLLRIYDIYTDELNDYLGLDV